MFSICIPTYKASVHFIKCLQSVINYTDHKTIEIIIYTNGSPKETIDFIDKVKVDYPDLSIKHLNCDWALGYTKPMNECILKSKGEYVILFNDDNELLPQQTNLWLDLLKEPFLSNDKVGISGISENVCRFTGEKYLVGFGLCISRKCLIQTGLLDKSLGLGHASEIDYQLRARCFGWETALVSNNTHEENGLVIGGFPIFHAGEATCHQEDVDKWFRPDALKAQKELAKRKSSGYYDAPFKLHGGIDLLTK